MSRLLRQFERGIVVVLIVLMMIAVLASTLELALTLVRQLLEPPRMLLGMAELLEVFGFFLMVLIGLELLETIKAYLAEDKMHVEVVFLVAMVAMARKVIILDYTDLTPPVLYGIAVVILALAAGYFLVRRALNERPAAEP